MKRISISYVSLSLLGLLISCQVDLEVPLPQHQAQLAVFAYWRAGEPLDTYVYRSRGINETNAPGNYLIPDATVGLFRNGELIDTLQYQDAPIQDTTDFRMVNGDTLFEITVYEGAKYAPSPALSLPQAGEHYQIRVSHPDYPSVIGETFIQPEPVVRNMSLGLDSLTFRDLEGNNPRTWTALYATVEDVSPEENYYMFFFKWEYERERRRNGQAQLDTLFENRWAHTRIERALEGYYYGETYPLSDSLFNGGQGELTSYLYMPREREYLFAPHPDSVATEYLRPLRIQIFTFVLSDAYGRYQSALRSQSASRSSGIEGILFPPEATMLPGNVDGGYGMVGSLQVTDTVIKIIQ